MSATIEVARAIDAAKRYVVVANEVKTHANQTATSTIEITDIIGNLQAEMKNILASM